MTPRRSRWGWWFGDLGNASGDAPGEALASSHAGAPEVIRFGGSLLERAEWPELAGLLLEPPFGGGPALPLTLVVGGGGIVEGLRGIDRTRPLDQRLVHRLAIDGMGITARLVASTLGLPLVTRPIDRHAVLDMAGWLAADPARGEGIPASWSVTSDSLAAIVAAAHACDLLLAKSVPPPRPPGAARETNLASLAGLGWVDGWFPEAATGVARVRWAAPARGSKLRARKGRGRGVG